MCRKNILRGYSMILFGIGLLIGKMCESGWWIIAAGVGLIVLGVCLLQRTGR